MPTRLSQQMGGPAAGATDPRTPGGRHALSLILARDDGRTVRVFASLGLGTIAVLLGLALLPGGTRPIEPTPGTVSVLLLGAIVATVAIALPWDRLSTPQAAIALRVLMVLGIGAVGALVATTGGARSDQLWAALLITIFAAVVCDPREQVALLALTAGAYVTGSAVAGPVPLGVLAYRLVILATVAVLAGYLSSLLRRAVLDAQTAHAEAATESARLSTIARGMKAAADPDPDEVVRTVTDTLNELGWEHTRLYLRGPGGRLQPAGRPDGEPDLDDVGLLLTRFAALALEDNATVTVSDAGAEPRLREAVDRLGIAAAMATPFHADGEPVGAIVASTGTPHRFTPTDVGTFELVATGAGRSLELARLYAGQRQRVSDLEQLDRLRSEFLSTVSHELRTPLTVILGLSETLDVSWDRMSEGQRRQLLDRVHENSGGLDRVIATLLDFTRLEQGRLETRFTTFDAARLIVDVCRRLEPMFERHDLDVQVTGTLEARGDERLIERVLENLLSNARRHTAEGTRIVVTAAPAADSVRIAVSDEGPGIPAADLPRLGERFFRAGGADDERPEGSMGLGLALAHEVLRLHGARLRVDSELGRGTTFSFELPAPAADDAVVHVRDRAPRPAERDA